MFSHRSVRPMLYLFAILTAVLLGTWVSPAHADTGICQLDCFQDFTSCMSGAPNCRVDRLNCRDGSQCSNNGMCRDGTRCPVSLSPGCNTCISERTACLSTCPPTFLPEAVAAVINSKLRPDIQWPLLRELAAAENALAGGVQQSVDHLEAYRSMVNELLKEKKIDKETAAALDEVAKRSAATLQSASVPECVSTLTTFGEGIFVNRTMDDDKMMKEKGYKK